MARKTTFLEKRKECTQTFKRMTRLNMRGYSDKMIYKNLLEVKNDDKKEQKKKEIHNVRLVPAKSSTKSSRVVSQDSGFQIST